VIANQGGQKNCNGKTIAVLFRNVSLLMVGIWQYSTKDSPHSVWIWGIFCKIPSIPVNIVMDLDNVMRVWTYDTYYPREEEHRNGWAATSSRPCKDKNWSYICECDDNKIGHFDILQWRESKGNVWSNSRENVHRLLMNMINLIFHILREWDPLKVILSI